MADSEEGILGRKFFDRKQGSIHSGILFCSSCNMYLYLVKNVQKSNMNVHVLVN